MTLTIDNATWQWYKNKLKKAFTGNKNDHKTELNFMHLI